MNRPGVRAIGLRLTLAALLTLVGWGSVAESPATGYSASGHHRTVVDIHPGVESVAGTTHRSHAGGSLTALASRSVAAASARAVSPVDRATTPATSRATHDGYPRGPPHQL